MEAKPERTTEKAPAASEAKASEESQRPDWLMGADEMVASEADFANFKGATAPFAPPRANTVPPPAGRDPAPAAEGAPASSAENPGAPWSMPVREIVTGPDMYDHRREREAGSSPGGTPAGGSSVAPGEPEKVWHKGSITDELAVEIDPFGDEGESQPAPIPFRLPPEPQAPSSWQLMVNQIRTDRRIHLAALVLALAAVIAPVIKDQLSVVPVGKIRRDPVAFDGQKVKLRGTVGEVFEVGSSFTYYLHDGRDTIVVFTRMQPPRSRERVTVIGSISTGYLEGVPRAALFQNAP